MVRAHGCVGTGEYPAPVRRFTMLATVLVMVAALAAGCGDDGGDGDDGGATASTVTPPTVPAPAPSTTAATAAPTSLTLRMTDVQLVNSEESDNGLRVLLPAGVATASVTLAGLPSPNRVISVCQARDLERRLTTAVCRTPASGEAVAVALGDAASGVEIVQVGVSSAGPAGNSTVLGEVTIRYAASSRELSARLPQIAAGGSGGRPLFSLTPPGASGSYRATLTWTVIQVFGGSPSSGLLELVRGDSVLNRAEGGGLDVRLSGEVPAPVGDAAIRAQNVGSSAMVSPKLTLLLP